MVTVWVKKSSYAWPSEGAGAGVMANGSFASFHLGSVTMADCCVHSWHRLHANDEHTPLHCINKILSCVLDRIFDDSASNGGDETVSRAYRYDSFGLHGYVMLCIWWHMR